MPFNRFFHGLPRLTKGWQLQGITRFATGFPVQMGQGNPVSGPLCTQVDPNPDKNLVQPLCVGDASLVGSPSTDLPNLVGPIHKHNPRDSGEHTYFDQSAFVATACNLTFP